LVLFGNFKRRGVRKMGKSWKRAIVQSSVTGYRYKVLADSIDEVVVRRQWNVFARRLVLKKAILDIVPPPVPEV